MRLLSRLVLLALLAAGCAAAPAATPGAPATQPTTAPGSVEALRGPAPPPPPAVSLAPPAGGLDAADYRLAPKDALKVVVHGQDDLTRTVRVTESGAIKLPLVGEVKAAGLTARELEQRIETGLRGTYLKQPRVNVVVTEYLGRQVAVLGAVEQPGAYTLKTNGTTVLVALSDARGVKDGADRMAYVLRATPRDGEPQPLTVDLDALMRAGDPRHNVVVEPGDTVYVPDANTFYVSGEVEKRGAFRLRRDMTISKALIEAGGVTKLASDVVTVIRTGPTGERRELPPVNLAAVQRGDRSHDLALQAHDVVVVPASGTKTVAYNVLDVLKGLFRFGFAIAIF
ncbi:MAG: polysaccharide biosynthesis/export family protein [Candidatus Rokuibacteriota bacterium]